MSTVSEQDIGEPNNSMMTTLASHDAIFQTSAEIEQLIQTSDQLQDTVVIAQEQIALGITSKIPMPFVSVALERVYSAVGIEFSEPSVEGIGSTLKAFWDALIKALKAIWDSVAKHFDNIFNGMTRVRVLLEKRIASIKDAPDTAKVRTTFWQDMANFHTNDTTEFLKAIQDDIRGVTIEHTERMYSKHPDWRTMKNGSVAHWYLFGFPRVRPKPEVLETLLTYVQNCNEVSRINREVDEITRSIEDLKHHALKSDDQAKAKSVITHINHDLRVVTALGTRALARMHYVATHTELVNE